MKKTLTSFVVAGTLTIGNISAIASEYITNTVDVITHIDSKEKIKKNSTQIADYMELLAKSDKEFQDKVIPFMLDNYKELNSHEFGAQLANIALAIKGKELRYETMMKLFRKDKKLISYNKKIIELKNNNKIIKEKIQETINLVFMHIEAKGIFEMAKADLALKKTSDISLKDYWYTRDLEEEDKALFISIEQEDDINLDSIYALEDVMSDNIDKAAELKMKTMKNFTNANGALVDDYNFNAMSRIFFKRVSIV